MLSLFNNPNKRNYTAVFVDYEHWFYSMKHDYHTKPEVTEWMAGIGKDYDVKHWLAFANFNYEEIGREMQILQTAGFQVINSCYNFTYHKKGQTEFALLNQLYQYAINYPEVKTYVLFTEMGTLNLQSDSSGKKWTKRSLSGLSAMPSVTDSAVLPMRHMSFPARAEWILCILS